MVRLVVAEHLCWPCVASGAGDKVETAMNIGYACNLLNSAQKIFVIASEESDREEMDEIRMTAKVCTPPLLPHRPYMVSHLCHNRCHSLIFVILDGAGLVTRSRPLVRR
jgi:magnesium-transporting ATPase (P-type)